MKILLLLLVLVWAAPLDAECYGCAGGVCSSDAHCVYPCVCADRAPGPGVCVQ